MTTVERALIEHWSELRLYPALLSLIVDTSRGVDLGEAAERLLVDIATPRSEFEAFNALLSAGEFGAASMFVTLPAHRSPLANPEHAVFEEALATAQRRAYEQLQTRVALLRARAQRVNLDDEPPVGLEEANQIRRTWAEELLDEWEGRIQLAESHLAAELRAELSSARRRLVSPERDLSTWQAAVEQCIEAREYPAAQFLLAGGPTIPPADEPVLVPRRAEWPWNEPLKEAIGWALGTKPAPAEFHSSWRHESDDRPAAALVETLGGIVEAGVVSRQVAGEFAERLDAFLGSERAGAYDVAGHTLCWETRLYALDDARLPLLRISGRSGVRLFIAASPQALPPDNLSQSGVMLWFDPWHTPLPQDRALTFDAWSILRLLADRRYRRVNFLRDLGSRVELNTAIPANLAALRLPAMNQAELRIYAQWLFDILNLEPEGPSFIDVMLYYCGARQELLLQLMRALLGTIANRRESITLDQLARVWESPGFQHTARQELLAPLETDPLPRAVLGATLWYAEHAGDPVTVDEIRSALELWNAERSISEVSACFDRLAALHLIEVIEPGVGYRVPQSGIGILLLAALTEAGEEEYIRDALQQAGYQPYEVST